jgi:phosphotriesterase-related protein
MISTVLGYIERESLGFCQAHEHLSIADGYPASINPDQRIDDTAKSAEELASYQKAGGAAVVDAQPVGCCRNALMLAEISMASGVHIIASTGFHLMRFYPAGHWIYSVGADELERIFISEIRGGMFVNCDAVFPSERCAVKAGQIKIALDCDETAGKGGNAPASQYQKLCKAAAAAQKKTGASLMVHIEKGADPLRFADFLDKAGVALNRVIFCHMDRSIEDISVHKAVCKRGITLEYDTVGRYKYHDDAKEIEILQELLQAGYEKQILMSLDVTRGRLAGYGGQPGLCFILEKFIPLLRRRGITEEVIQSIFVENPAKIFDLA